MEGISIWKCPGGGVLIYLGYTGTCPLDRVWFFGLAVLNRVFNLTCLCPKPVLNRVRYYEPRDLNSDCVQPLSFLSLRPEAW